MYGTPRHEGRRWLWSVCQIGLALAVHAVVRRWGMGWYFGSTALLLTALSWGVWRTVWLCLPTRPRTRVRRIILEEVWR